VRETFTGYTIDYGVRGRDQRFPLVGAWERTRPGVRPLTPGRPYPHRESVSRAANPVNGWSLYDSNSLARHRYRRYQNRYWHDGQKTSR
jgi:hypothetical protein